MSGMAPTLTAVGSLMSKLIPTVRLVATFQCTEPFRTFLIFPRHTGTGAPAMALTGLTTQPSQPCTTRVSDVVLAAARAWPSTAGTTAKTAVVKAAAVRMRRACLYMRDPPFTRDQVG